MTGKLWHRRSCSLGSPAECRSWLAVISDSGSEALYRKEAGGKREVACAALAQQGADGEVREEKTTIFSPIQYFRGYRILSFLLQLESQCFEG